MTDPIQHNSTLSTLDPAQAHVAAALAAGQTITDAARSAGVHRSTVHNWLNTNAAFGRAFDEIRHNLVDSLRDRVQALQLKALEQYETLLEDSATPPAVRLRAILEILRNPPKIATVPPPEPDPVPEDAPAAETAPVVLKPPTTARNAPCPCGSRNKYKRCCGKNAPPVSNPIKDLLRAVA